LNYSKCEQCGEAYQRNPRAKQQRFCSQRCRDRWRRAQGNDKIYQYICAYCGKEFITSHKEQRYCSKRCVWTHYWRAKGSQDKCCKRCGVVLTNGKTSYCSDECRMRECKTCGKRFLPERTEAYCSDECRKEQARRKAKENFVSVKETNPYIDLSCKYCGQQFKVNYRANKRRYCSEQCAKKASKNERRYRKRGQFVAPVYRAEIYKRDGGICQLCGKKVDMTKEVPHPKAPVLDHIIPLSRGGTHEPKNVQLAHFICNSLKSDKVLGEGEQLKLF
jgi:endogenous inhibitor of DNA gyrase (YacG/DUF329 family)